jgi:integrase
VTFQQQRRIDATTKWSRYLHRVWSGHKEQRASCAKLCQASGGALEQIQLLLGHASVQTTERYLDTNQDLVNAPTDAIKLKVA